MVRGEGVMDFFDKLSVALFAWSVPLLLIGLIAWGESRGENGRKFLRIGTACAVLGTLSFIFG